MLDHIVRLLRKREDFKKNPHLKKHVFYRSTYYVNVIEEIIQKAEIALRGNKMADIKAERGDGQGHEVCSSAPFPLWTELFYNNQPFKSKAGWWCRSIIPALGRLTQEDPSLVLHTETLSP